MGKRQEVWSSAAGETMKSCMSLSQHILEVEVLFHFGDELLDVAEVVAQDVVNPFEVKFGVIMRNHVAKTHHADEPPGKGHGQEMLLLENMETLAV